VELANKCVGCFGSLTREGERSESVLRLRMVPVHHKIKKLQKGNSLLGSDIKAKNL